MKPEVLMTPVRSNRLYEGVLEQLYSLIASGQVGCGERLPSERELCDGFGVSRTSVRAALRTLGALGLVETKNGGGTFVTRGSPESLGEILSVVLFHDFSDLEQIYEARRAIETWTVYLAAGRITAGELGCLEQLADRQEREVRGGESGIETDFAFHLTIGKAARNEIISRLLYSMITLIFKGLDPSKRPASDLAIAVDQHREIIGTLRNRDGIEAMRLMWNHIRGGPESPFAVSSHQTGD
ncbi:MAG TPA: FadR/GntR family transcriptional regulator [Bryobacteraceae bacterium]|nr:FadR/GntR family transcriptional regulator [Bryobacteraceae bacterium]